MEDELKELISDEIDKIVKTEKPLSEKAINPYDNRQLRNMLYKTDVAEAVERLKALIKQSIDLMPYQRTPIIGSIDEIFGDLK